MSGSISIRPARVEDEGALLELLEALGEHYAALEPVLPERWRSPAGEERRRERLRALWNDPERHVAFLAHAGEVAVGSCRVELDAEGPTPAVIRSLVVLDGYRGRGVGGRLMDAALGWCEARGLTEVGLDVLPGNVEAAAFHERLGFRPYLVRYVRSLTPP